MAAYKVRDVTKTRRIYSLPSPTNWVEVSKLLNALGTDPQRIAAGDYDDTVTVEAWDDEIRFSFEVKS